MKKSNKTFDTQISKNRSKLLQGAGLALSLAMIFSTVSCSKAKADDGRTVSADEAYFSSAQLDFSSAIEGGYASIESVKQFRDKIGILISGTSDYYIQIYDNDGQLISQTALEDAIDPESNLVDMADDADGNLHVLTQFIDVEMGKFISELFTFDSKGALVGKPLIIPVEELVSDSQMEVDNKGNIYLCLTSDGTGMRSISVFNSKGTKLFDIPGTNGLYLGTLLQMKDQMYTAGNDMTSEKSEIGLYPIDNAKEKLGNPIDITNTLGSYGGSLNIGKDGLYSANAKGVYSVSLDDKKTTPVFLWDNTNFKKAANNTDQVIVLSARKTMVVTKTTSDNISIASVSLLTHAAKNPDAGKKIITIAGSTVSLDSAVSAAVHDFNMNSKKYRVEIHEYYGNPAVSSNTISVVNAMNLEILSGDAPDIIYGDIQLFANCEKKGVLADLYSMMENDSTFNKDDVIPSILKICETDGHLYKLGTGFGLSGFVGAKSIIGDRTGWTVGEFNSIAESLPDKVTPLIGYSQSELLDWSLSANMDSYVDSKSGTVRFDSDDFRSLLDYAKTYGEPDSDTDAIRPGSAGMIANGELAMHHTWIDSPVSYAEEVVIFGEPISVTGYPSSEKSTASCYMPAMLAIYSGSGNKEAAWEFFKYFYTEKAQTSLDPKNQIPVLKSVFEEQIETALNPDPNTGGSMLVDSAGNPVPMSAEIAEGYKDLINGMNSLGSYDYEIRDIVMEEVAPYFYDQKSQDDVIAIIQERVQTLVDERQ